MVLDILPDPGVDRIVGFLDAWQAIALAPRGFVAEPPSLSTETRRFRAWGVCSEAFIEEALKAFAPGRAGLRAVGIRGLHCESHECVAILDLRPDAPGQFAVQFQMGVASEAPGASSTSASLVECSGDTLPHASVPSGSATHSWWSPTAAIDSISRSR